MAKARNYHKEIKFCLKKAEYHANRFIYEFEKTSEKLKAQFQAKAIQMIKNREDFISPRGYDLTAIHRFNGEMSNECFFEFDSYMVECKRFLDYVIKQIESSLNLSPSGKGCESFFNNLNPNYTQSRRKSCEELFTHNPKMVSYLWSAWIKWIKDLHTYRTISVHQYIPNRVHGTVKCFWNSVQREVTPSKVSLEDLYVMNCKINTYVKSTHKKLVLLYNYLRRNQR